MLALAYNAVLTRFKKILAMRWFFVIWYTVFAILTVYGLFATSPLVVCVSLGVAFSGYVGGLALARMIR
jgi:hypothetical protein